MASIPTGPASCSVPELSTAGIVTPRPGVNLPATPILPGAADNTAIGIGYTNQGRATAYVAKVQGEVACAYLKEYYKPNNDWQKYLAGVIGVYSIIKQYQIMKDYLSIAQEQIKQSERLVQLAEKNYQDISLTAFTKQKNLFERYLTEFSSYENTFVSQAFKEDCYTPDYDVQRGRAIGAVQAAFDSAAKQRSRMRGRYNAGRACHDNVYFAIETAKARVSASDHAYRFEEARQWRFTQWYWSRKTQGAAYVADMSSRVVSGLNGGASIATSGFGNIANAVGARGDAVRGLDGPISNIGNFYGGIAQQAFGFAGYQIGKGQAAQFNPGGFGANTGMGQIGVPSQAPAISASAIPTGSFGIASGNVQGGNATGSNAMGNSMMGTANNAVPY